MLASCGASLGHSFFFFIFLLSLFVTIQLKCDVTILDLTGTGDCLGGMGANFRPVLFIDISKAIESKGHSMS